MPCVFKYTTSQTSVDLTADGVKYATCQFYSGEEFTTFSTLTCTVNDALKSSIKAFGTVTLPIAFNVGGTGSSTDLEDSKCFTAGTNTVTFNDGDKDISIDVEFEKSTLIQVDICMLPELCQVSIRSTLLWHHNVKMVTHLVQWGSPVVGDVAIDCSNIHIGITKGLNDWNYPVSSESFSYTKTLHLMEFIKYQNVPAGYRPFIDAYISATDVNQYIFSIYQ